MVISVVDFLVPKNENHFVELVLSSEEISRGFYSDPRCFPDRITIRATTDGWESDRLDFILNRKLQRIPITIDQDLTLMVFSSSPNWANRVNYEPGRQTISPSNLRFTGLATADRPAFCEQVSASGAMNRAIDSSSTEKRRIRRVYNRIDIELGNVAAKDVDLAIGILHQRF